MKYIAVVSDLIHSRQIEERLKVQERIKVIFQQMNKKYKELIISRLTLTLGDEFQVILKPQGEIFQFLDDLEYRMELPFRTGIGYGTLLTEIDPKMSVGADGEAFWHAREAIEKLREKDWNGRSKVFFRGLGSPEEEMLNTLLLLSDTIKDQWTSLQRETFHELLKRGIYQENFEQKSLAREMGISQSSLSKRLSGGGIKMYLHARHTLGSSLEVWHARTES
jgi:hypothetical protein